MKRGVDRPFDRRAFFAFERLAVKVGGKHLVRAKTTFVRAHAGSNEDPFGFRLVDADVTEHADHSLHRKNTRAGGQLFSQFIFACHRSYLLWDPSSSFFTSSTN